MMWTKLLNVKLIIMAFIAYLIYDMFVRRKTVEDDFGDFINVDQGTYPAYRYEEWCDIIYSAGRGLGTTDEDIMRVMGKMRNTNDVKKLKETWGKKANNSSGTFFSLVYPDITLAGYLAEEGVTEACNTILKSKGIKELF